MNHSNEFSIKDDLINHSDINNSLRKTSILLNERKDNLFFYIYFLIALLALIILIIMNSSASSKLKEIEVKYKEIEVNSQRDKKELNGIEERLAKVINGRNEVNNKHIELIAKYKQLNGQYDEKKQTHITLKKEIDDLQQRERDISAQIKVMDEENVRLELAQKPKETIREPIRDPHHPDFGRNIKLPPIDDRKFSLFGGHPYRRTGMHDSHYPRNGHMDF